MKIKVGVIFGGESVEHEISIITALQAMDNLNPNKYEIIPIYIAKNNEWYTSNTFRDINTFKDLTNIPKIAKNIFLYRLNNEYVLQEKNKKFKKIINTLDVALLVVHGTNVEDGTLQGYLKTIDIPFTGTDVYSSVVGQDKIYMKQIFASENIPIPKFTWCYDTDYLTDSKPILEQIKKIGYPVIVKPATLGSSVGISYAKNETEVKKCITDALNYDNRILIEEAINNLREVNISLLGNYENIETSVIEEVNSNHDFLTYEDKYVGNKKTKSAKGMLNTNRAIPANISKELEEEIKNIAIKAFRALNSKGVVRIDFLIDDQTKKVYINEINNIPGSLAFYLWENTHKSYSTLLDELISLAIKDYKKNKTKEHSFNTNILNTTSYGLKGLKK